MTEREQERADMDLPRLGRKTVRIQLAEQQGWICPYCRRTMNDSKPSKGDWLLATLDHIIPLSLGGSDTRRNLVACCLDCNRHKNSATPARLREMADRIESLAWWHGLTFPAERYVPRAHLSQDGEG